MLTGLVTSQTVLTVALGKLLLNAGAILRAVRTFSPMPHLVVPEFCLLSTTQMVVSLDEVAIF